MRKQGQGWSIFLGSLSTSGGNLFLLAIFSLIIMSTVIFLMVKFGPGAPVVITLTGTFSAFTGAMIGILRGSRVDTPTPGMTVETTTHTQTQPPPVPVAPAPQGTLKPNAST